MLVLLIHDAYMIDTFVWCVGSDLDQDGGHVKLVPKTSWQGRLDLLHPPPVLICLIAALARNDEYNLLTAHRSHHVQMYDG